MCGRLEREREREISNVVFGEVGEEREIKIKKIIGKIF